MDVELRKDKLLVNLRDLEGEARELIDRIAKARADLGRVKTEEDARKFDETHDLEEGFKQIRLF